MTQGAMTRRGLAAVVGGLGALALPAAAAPPAKSSAPRVPVGNFRVPEARFENLPDFPFKPNYAEVYGTRMHYVDEGKGSPVLMLHGEPSWGYLYRKYIPPIAGAGHRAIVPDHVGFGRSDKWLAAGRYTFSAHYSQLEELIIGQLDLNDITLVCQDWGGMLGLTLAGHYPDRFSRLVIMNTTINNPKPPDPSASQPAVTRPGSWRSNSQQMLTSVAEFGEFFRKSPGEGRELSDGEVRAYGAPWPTKESRVSALRFPKLFGNSTDPEDPGFALMREAYAVMQDWSKPVLLMWGAKDNVFPIDIVGQTMHRLFKTSNEPIRFEGGGHFVQENDPPRMTKAILNFLAKA